jgi:hypothetical protein
VAGYAGGSHGFEDGDKGEDVHDRAECGVAAPALAVELAVHGPGEHGDDRWAEEEAHDRAGASGGDCGDEEHGWKNAAQAAVASECDVEHPAQEDARQDPGDVDAAEVAKGA